MKKIILFCDGGLGNRMNVLIGGILLGKKINREVIINWPVNQWCGVEFKSLFNNTKYEITEDSINDLFVKFKDTAAFTIHVNQTKLHLKYSYDIRNYSLDSLRNIENDVMIYYHNRIPEYHSNEERIITLKELYIQQYILDHVDLFCKSNNITKEVLGYHLRRTDMELPPSTTDMINLVQNNVHRKFFICSDDLTTESALNKFTNVIVYEKTSYVEKFVEGKWNQPLTDADGRNTNYNVQRTARSVIEAFIDLLVLSKTNIQTRTPSTFVQLALLYNQF